MEIGALMPDEVTEGNAGAEAAPEQQATPSAVPAAESQTVQGQQTATATPSWKFGGNVYNDPNKLYEAASKWEADFTRKSQGWAAKEKDYADKVGKYESIISAIRSDPQLTQQVIAKMQAGMTQRQAVESTAQQMDPAVASRIEALEKAEQERQYDAAVDAFFEKHKDITKEEDDAMEAFLKENEEWLGRIPPERQLAMAYAEIVVPRRQAALIAMGQKQKAEEVQNGKKSSFLGSQAPTASAKAGGMPERKRHMTPAEERAYAQAVWERNAAKK